MSVPLAITLPAAAAGLAYLNARSAFWYDLFLLRCAVPVAASLALQARRGALNQFRLLEERAKSKASANRPFILFGDKTYTYAETYDRALRYGTWCREWLGIKEKEIVAMDFMNSDNFVFMWMGLWSIGAVPAFINYNLRGPALVHCVRTSGARLMIVDAQVADVLSDDVRALLDNVRIDVFTAELEAAAVATDPVRYPDAVRHETEVSAMCMLVYTSGTTGLPKAATVSWGKIVTVAGMAKRLLVTEPGDVMYTCMPLYHSAAAIIGLLQTLTSGATIAIGARFQAKTFWADIRRYNCTAVQYVGETCRYLLAAPPDLDPVTHENLDKKHKVRIFVGNGLRPDVWNRFKERFAIETVLEFYAGTEGSMATFNLSRNDFTMGAVGRNGWLYMLLMGSSVRLVDMDPATDLPARDGRTGLCRRTPAGQPGELVFQLPERDIERRFQGYYNDRKATDAKVMRDVFRKGDAWFRTGDIMRWDREGRLYFHDRLGDTFRWKSENVSTAEVAQQMGTHAAVHEANVYGVQLPHHDGRAGCVALSLAGGDGALSRELLADLAAHVRAGLPRYAVPLFLRLIPGGPGAHITGTNKQLKHELREQGVAPGAVGGDRLFWLKNGTYEPFGRPEWDELSAGRVKL